tara:strand:+ start:214 stop:777 length:564 start_codon:yes stop_codon:yes gene_type:complete
MSTEKETSHGGDATTVPTVETSEECTCPTQDRRIIWVFGSNLAGRHGAGYALYCRIHHGAIYGQGIGLQGDSYAIPTKDRALKLLSLERIQEFVEDFMHFALEHPELEFNVSPIGCGLARPPNQSREERARDIRSLFENWSKRDLVSKTFHAYLERLDLCLPNVNLPIEFGGTYKSVLDANGEETSK